MAERRSPGSYFWDQETYKGPLRGCLRIRGAVIWSCPHEHHSTAAARDCARGYLIAHPEVGRPVMPTTTEVPLHKLVGNKLPGLDWEIDWYYTNGNAYTAGGPKNVRSSLVDEDGMVEVQT